MCLSPVIHLEGTTPTKYGLLLSNDSRYKVLKKELSKLCGLDPTQLLLVEIFGSTVKVLYADVHLKGDDKSWLRYLEQHLVSTIYIQTYCSFFSMFLVKN